MSDHGNTGYNIKNLKGTSGCSHYRDYQANKDSETKCAVNGCSKYANRACHIISSNQNGDSGVRKIVYMCPSHNGIYEVLNIRSNALTYTLDNCNCGYI